MSPQAALFGFGFLHWAMLGWLSAAALPILIHLWNRRQHRETTWAAMDFLLAALRKSSRRLRLEQWLLLAVRTLLIVLLVLAVAEPFLEQLGPRAASGERTHKVLVIDGSLSMTYRPTDRDRFQRAKELAQQIVEESPQGDGFTLVVLSDPPRVVVGTPALEGSDFLEEISALRPTDGRGDLTAALAEVQRVIERAGQEQPRLARTEIYFLTDLARTTWSPAGGATKASESRALARKLAEQAALVVVDLGQQDVDNVAVMNLRSREPIATVGRALSLDVAVHNFGRQDRPGLKIALAVDGRKVADQAVDVAAGGDALATFSYSCDSPGDHVFEASVADDLLSADNNRYLSLAVRESIQVLCVNGRLSGEPFGGATDYLSVALSPETEEAGLSGVRPEVVTETALVERDLAPYDCVFLCNVAQFTSSEARALASYLRGGGGVVFFVGDRVQSENYNRQLIGDEESAPRILPATLGEVVAENQYSFDPLGYRHKIVEAFRGQERAGLLTTPVSKYIKATPLADPGVQVALAFNGGDPVIVEAPRYRGRVLLVTTSADTSWTTMPVWPSYVPVVQELLMAAMAGRASERNSLVGQPISSTLRGGDSDALVEIAAPDGTKGQARLETDGDRSQWSYDDTPASGIYTVTPPEGSAQSFAVNVDTIESDLTKLTASELAGDVWSGIPFTHRTNWQNLDEQSTAPVSHRNDMHRWLLYGVLFLLIGELLLAFGLGWKSR